MDTSSNDDDDDDNGYEVTSSAPTTSHLNVVVQSPSLHWGGVEMACRFPEGLILGQFSLRQLFFSFFIPAVQCAVTYIWTAFLNPIDRPPISSTFFRIILLSPSFHPKPLYYLSHPPLILIFMLLLISRDIHPNPGSTDPCSVCSRRVTWGNRSVQCTNCSLWVHLSCSGSGLGLGLVWVFLPLTFVKSPQNTLDLSNVLILFSTPPLPLTP